MNLIKQVLKDINSNKVEYMPLGKLVKIETGKLNANAAVADGEFMFFTTATEPSRIDKYRWDTEALLIAGNANVGAVQHYKGKFEAYQRTYVLTEAVEVLDIRFLYYILCNGLGQYLSNRSKKAAMTYIVLSDLQNFPVPIPPLPVQEEIVRILDTFTELIAELKAELTARKKQYEFYRDELLKLEGVEGVEWKKLGELLGYEQPTKYIVKSTGYDESYETPVLTAGQTFILGYTDEVEGIYQATKDKPVIIFDDFTTGFHWVDFDFKVKSSAMKFLKPKHDGVNFRYIYHCMRTLPFELDGHRRRWIREYSELEIPIPSLAEQERIVSILDQFDTLTNSLTEGIPAEIELRQKQYEFYREKLLTFKRRHVSYDK